MSDFPELTDDQFKSAISARQRKRLTQGRFESGEDITALRNFVGLTQAEFARAIEISVHTLRNWEQGRRKPEGPALIVMRNPASHYTTQRFFRQRDEKVQALLAQSAKNSITETASLGFDTVSLGSEDP